MTRGEARAALRLIAARVVEPDSAARAERLLERVASRDDGPELRAALAEIGAQALLVEVFSGEDLPALQESRG